MASKQTWGSFLHTADEFIIGYATLSGTVIAPPLFMIGHAVELYLKAANAKITGDIDRAVSFSHRMKYLWDDCKQKDGSFMPSYEIRKTVFDCPFLEQDIVTLLSEPDCMHFLDNQDLYIVAKHLMDLKYLGAPLKSIKRQYAITWCSHNPYWISFFKEMRTYLGYPASGGHDWIKYTIEKGIDPRAEAYLKQLTG